MSYDVPTRCQHRKYDRRGPCIFAVYFPSILGLTDEVSDVEPS